MNKAMHLSLTIGNTHKAILSITKAELSNRRHPAKMTDMDSRILQVQTMTGHHFQNKLPCAEALQMKEPNCPLRVEGTLHLFHKNRDLELVGDAVIDAVLATMWYEARDHNGISRLQRSPQLDTDYTR